MWLDFWQSWSTKSCCSFKQSQVAGHVGLPKLPGYKSPPLQKWGREEAGEKYYIQTPDRYFGLEVVQPKAPQIYTLDNVVNWQHWECSICHKKSCLKNNCCSVIDMNPKVYLMHNLLLHLKTFQLNQLNQMIWYFFDTFVAQKCTLRFIPVYNL